MQRFKTPRAYSAAISVAALEPILLKSLSPQADFAAKEGSERSFGFENDQLNFFYV